MKKYLCLAILFFLPGFCQQSVSYQHFLKEGPLSIHVLEVDPAGADIKLVHAGRQILALEKVSSMVERYRAYGGVNGGFFKMKGIYAGTSMGLLKISGELLASPRFGRGAVGWMNGGREVLIDRVGMSGEMKIDDRVFPVEKINQPRVADEAVLYTSFFYPSTLTEPEGAEMLITYGETVMGVKRGGNHLIPSGGWIYSFGPRYPLQAGNELRGREVEFSIRLKPLNHPENEALWNRMEEITNGAPVLVTGGKKAIDKAAERLPAAFSDEKHARTAVGIKPDGHWIFVVIEKTPINSSAGVTLDELADLMMSLGAHEALNLDGGGSSTMVLEGKMVNALAHDEDTPRSRRDDERTVSDAILIFLKPPRQSMP